MPKSRTTLFLGICIVFFAIAIVYAKHAGSYLVANQPAHADVIVVLGGDHNDRRYWAALDYLRKGYAPYMIVDAMNTVLYGHTQAELAADFAKQTGGTYQSQIRVCTITQDSTVQETDNLRVCLAQLQPVPKSALLVTTDFHTNRALSIMRARLPQYAWSVAAVQDPDMFGKAWWRHREWAKTCLTEWQKYLWWKIAESWRK